MTTFNTQIPTRERLIFALDVPNLEEAHALISNLGDSVEFYKLGLEVFLSGNYFELMAELKGKGKKVFADLKLFDIPATVAAAVRQLAKHQGDLDDLGFQCDVRTLVLSRAKRALALGCDGVVSSGLEVSALREHAEPRLIAVCPGIRPIHNDDDQQRVMTPFQAIRDGADYLVVGRPIRTASNPASAAEAIQEDIARALVSP